jgi:ferritin-like metal-binding protein YciE
MALESLSDLLEDELKDLFSAENQLLKALPKMAKRASAPALKEAFTEHLKETEEHVARLEQIGEILGIKLSGKTCKAMKGLVEEGSEAIEEEGPAPVIDSALIGAARRVEHYEMAAYCATRGMAEELDNDEVAKLLEETGNEEEAADDKLKSLAEDEIFVNAAKGDGSEAENEDGEVVATSKRGRSAK